MVPFYSFIVLFWSISCLITLLVSVSWLLSIQNHVLQIGVAVENFLVSEDGLLSAAGFEFQNVCVERWVGNGDYYYSASMYMYVVLLAENITQRHPLVLCRQYSA